MRRRTVLTAPAIYIAIWAIALSSADRLDLAGGHLAFKLTPFLVLSPCYLAFALMDLVAGRALPQSLLSNRRWLPLIGFVILAGISVILAQDDFLSLAASRYLLLLYLILFSTTLAIHASARGTLEQVLSVGSGLGMALYVLVSVVQLLGFANPDLQSLLSPGGGAVIDLVANYVGGVGFPRLSGLAGDPNRGAVSAAVFATLYFLFSRRRRRPYWILALGGVMVLLSWSRTGLVFYAVVLLALLWRHPKVVPALLAATLIGVVLATRVFPALNADLQAWSLLEARTSSEDVSTLMHLLLVEKAITLGFATDARTSLLGIGYGSEYSVTQDLFPDSKYANFHSNSLSVLVQTGVTGLLLFLLYSLLQPLGIGLANGFKGRYAAAGLAAAYFIAGLFYQYLAEPMFWLVLAVHAVLPRSATAQDSAPPTSN